MTPTRTQVFLCSSTKDYKRCRRFLKQVGQDHFLSYPTVYAIRDGRMIGVLSTTIDEGTVCAGPLGVSPSLRLKGLVAYRLIQVLESLYKQHGLDSYYIWVSHQNKGWQRVCDEFGLRPVYEDAENRWYIREGL